MSQNPGAFYVTNTEVFSNIEQEIENNIDSLGDLSQYDNCLDLPDNYDVDSEFSMDSLQALMDSGGQAVHMTRMPSTEEFESVNNLAELGYQKYLNYFHASVGALSCAQPFFDCKMYVPQGIYGFHRTPQFEGSWILNICWVQDLDKFDFIFYESDNKQIKVSKHNSKFNYRLYKIPYDSNTPFYHGKKSETYAFEWNIMLGIDVCQNICANWRGLRA